MKQFNIMQHLGIRSTNSIKKMHGILAYHTDSNGNSYHAGYVNFELRNKKHFRISLPKSYGYSNPLDETMDDLGFTHEQRIELRQRPKKDIDIKKHHLTSKKEMNRIFACGVALGSDDLSKIKHSFRLKNNLI